MLINPIELMLNQMTISICHICNTEADMLCKDCSEKTFSELDSRCYKCNKITSQNKVCASCRSSSKLRRVWWLASYDGVAKEIVWQTKFGRRRAYARRLGAILADSLPYLPEDTVVVSIPTASARIRRRGFDHAEILARSFADNRCLQYQNILARKSQADQIGKRRNERIKQMEGSLLIKRYNLSGKTILLIDDVITTGASVEAAAKTLRQSGALHVDAAVVTRHLLG